MFDNLGFQLNDGEDLSRIQSVLKHIANGGKLNPSIVEECKRAVTLLDGKMLDVPCIDCNEREIEYYMVTDIVWKQAGFETSKGIICIDCLEKRLSRKLTKDDFKDVPVNKLVRRMMMI